MYLNKLNEVNTYRVTRAPAVRWALLLGLLLAVSLPRFNLWDPWPISELTRSAKETPHGLPLDVAGYIRLTQYFRGDIPSDSLISPYCYRPLVPLLAAGLPLDAQSSINLIDVASLALTLVVLDLMLRFIGYERRARTIGIVLFAASFPVFYYGAIGFVDPPSVLLITLGAYLSLQGRTWLVGIVTLLGVFVKETNGVIALFPLLHGWATRRTGAWRFTLAFTMLAVAAAVGIRVVSSFPIPDFFWHPRLSPVIENLSRPRALLSLALTVGIPGLMALISIGTKTAQARLNRGAYRFLASGVALGVAVYAYSLTSAYADGRVIWMIYPFAIPIALTLVEAPGRVGGSRR